MIPVNTEKAKLLFGIVAEMEKIGQPLTVNVEPPASLESPIWSQTRDNRSIRLWYNDDLDEGAVFIVFTRDGKTVGDWREYWKHPSVSGYIPEFVVFLKTFLDGASWTRTS